MAVDDRAGDAARERTAGPCSHLFAVRLWTEDVTGGSEYRGSVRDVTSGAFRGFRDWSDLVAFMIDRMEEAANSQSGGAEGEQRWSLPKR